MSQRSTVMIVFGGQSVEHGVSCLTAAGVIGAIDRSRFDIQGVGIATDGSWHRVSQEVIEGLAMDGRTFPSVDVTSPSATLVRQGDQVRLATIEGDRLVDQVRVDVAFPLLHGPYGEDGTIQGQFEMLGLRYVGAGVAASAIGMDKHLMKVAFAAAGVRVGPFCVITPGEWNQDRSAALAKVGQLRFPVYVKPARGGSSLGISRVATPEGLEAAIEEARRHDPKVLVEEGFSDVREVECGVLGGRDGGPIRTSRPGEVVVHVKEGFYDFESKYQPTEDEVGLQVPAELTPQAEAAIREQAARCFEAIGAEGLSRLDAFLMPDGSCLANEINTMPGFTRFSMFPLMWQATGLTYPDLISDLIDQAMQRPLGLR